MLPAPLFAFLLALSAQAAPAAPETDLVVVFDTSGSMEERPAGRQDGPRKLEIAKEAMWGFIGELPPNVNLGVVSFSGLCDVHSVKVVPARPELREQMKQYVARLRPEGKTPIGQAMMRAIQLLSHSPAGRPKRIMVVTDGEETCDERLLEHASDLAWKQGIRVYAVGFDMGREPSKAFRRMGIYKDATDSKQLGAVFADIRRTLEKPLAAYDERSAGAADRPATVLAGRRGRFRDSGGARSGKLFTTLGLNSSHEYRFGSRDAFRVLEHGYHVMFDEQEYQADKVEVLRVRMDERPGFVFGGVEGFVFVEDVTLDERVD